MARAYNPKFAKIRKEKMHDIGQCELCGSFDNLELHHCIPLCFGGTNEQENLVLICKKCHTKITPTSLLVAAGKKAKQNETGFEDELEETKKLLHETENKLRIAESDLRIFNTYLYASEEGSEFWQKEAKLALSYDWDAEGVSPEESIKYKNEIISIMRDEIVQLIIKVNHLKEINNELRQNFKNFYRSLNYGMSED